MDSFLRLVIILVLIAIIASLGSALYHLSRSSGESSPKVVRALTLRVGLSLGLFILLMAAWYFGLISPHGLQNPPEPH
jgi:membrane associated rhomboid family serine protease